MLFRLDDALPVLRRTPAALRALLLNLPDPWIEATEGAGTWSPFDVVGHLIHGERTDWVPRVEHLLRHGETVPFPAFDREAMFVASQGLSLGELLDTFERLRAESLDRLVALGLSDADLARCGRHPEFGVVTLGQHLATWTAHDLTHVSQIVRVMARQYTMAVGPWRAYLSILGPASPAGIRGVSACAMGKSSRTARSTRVARPAPVQSTESPAKQLSGFIAKYDPAVATLVRAARAALRKRLPTAIELVYDNYQFLAIGFSSTERPSDCLVSLAVSPKGVALSFYYGASLPDPEGILLGSGNQNRFVRLDGPATLATPAVQAVLRAAMAQAETPLATTGHGHTLIRSVSAKQRPRRPTPRTSIKLK